MSYRQKGFTMVELLVSLSLVVVTMTVLMALFSGGMRLWQRSECGKHQDQEMFIVIEKIKKDLHQMQPFQLIPFKGGSDKMEFPFLINSSDFSDKVKELGRKKIFFNSQGKTLCENVQPYRGLKRSRNTNDCKALLEQIERVQFRYLSYNDKSEALNWSSRWAEDYFPVSIKMEIEYEDVCREQKSKKEFTIAIPVGPIR